MTPERARRTISELIALVGRSDVADLELTDGDLRLRLHRPKAKVVTHQPATGMRVGESMDSTGAVGTPPRTVRSLLVGRFYRARQMDDDPLVREGDTVVAGQVVGIVEAMNLFSEIESEENGCITRILVANGDRIEYGQPLMELE